MKRVGNTNDEHDIDQRFCEGRAPVTMTNSPTLLFAGDPHGNFAPILRACLAMPPGTLILVGDCDCPAPLAEVMAPAIAAGWRVCCDPRQPRYRHRSRLRPADRQRRDLGLRATDIGGLCVAGLPGVFKPRVWYPRADDPSGRIDPPRFYTRSDFQRALRPDEAWRGGLPLWHRDTIFPEDFDRLRSERFDVLVSHEAPSTHPHGFANIDRLAEACGARLIVHGHHHQAYDATLPNGIRVRGA